jgi:ribose transport system substrate-binding protein
MPGSILNLSGITMKYISIKILLIISVTFLVSFQGCNREKNGKSNEKVIALVVKTLNNPFFIDMEKGAEEAAAKLGVKLSVQAAEREVDVEQQMQIIENLIQRKVSAICVTPSGSREIIPVIIKANKAGIPVLAIDTKVDSAALKEAGGSVVTFIGSDNFQGGLIAGKYIIDLLNSKGKIAILEGLPGHETGDQRLAGFHAAVDSVDGIEIVASQTANWERDKGYTVFENILQANPEIEALFACNDMMALGAVEAISAAGRAGDITVVGFDATDDARESIKRNEMDASIAQHPFEMGRQAVETAVKIINGEKVPEYIPVKIEMITKDKLE